MMTLSITAASSESMNTSFAEGISDRSVLRGTFVGMVYPRDIPQHQRFGV
jgi:hypothetical protein